MQYRFAVNFGTLSTVFRSHITPILLKYTKNIIAVWPRGLVHEYWTRLHGHTVIRFGLCVRKV